MERRVLKGPLMKLAVTSQGNNLNSPLDPRFGRAKYFIVVDTGTGAFSAADNTMNLNAAQGAGIQAGKRVAELGVDALITGHVGPKAFSTLQAGGVKIYTGASGTVADAIEQFKADKLVAAASADVEGHWA
jgi:predicted Fe-Mo cluster-binding NifX family protein